MKLTKPKYVFVTGGVASSLGKGIISASIARLLQARGYSVTIQKLDPYINVDPEGQQRHDGPHLQKRHREGAQG